MKHLTGEASGRTDASAERCLSLISELADYPRWFGEVVRRASPVPSAPGRPERVDVTIVVAVGRLKRGFDFPMEVHRDDEVTVRLRRIPADGSDRETFSVTWMVRDVSPVELEVRLDAHLDVPPFVPIGGVGETLAQGLIRAAVAELRR